MQNNFFRWHFKPSKNAVLENGLERFLIMHENQKLLKCFNYKNDLEHIPHQFFFLSMFPLLFIFFSNAIGINY